MTDLPGLTYTASNSCERINWLPCKITTVNPWLITCLMKVNICLPIIIFCMFCQTPLQESCEPTLEWPPTKTLPANAHKTLAHGRDRELSSKLPATVTARFRAISDCKQLHQRSRILAELSEYGHNCSHNLARRAGGRNYQAPAQSFYYAFKSHVIRQLDSQFCCWSYHVSDITQSLHWLPVASNCTPTINNGTSPAYNAVTGHNTAYTRYFSFLVAAGWDLFRHMAERVLNVIDEQCLDVLAATKMYIKWDHPPAVNVKRDIAPPGYSVHHAHRQSSGKGTLFTMLTDSPAVKEAGRTDRAWRAATFKTVDGLFFARGLRNAANRPNRQA